MAKKETTCDALPSDTPNSEAKSGNSGSVMREDIELANPASASATMARGGIDEILIKAFRGYRARSFRTLIYPTG